ncbi:MAG: hypothetical protein BWY74_03504 [Firmicutes bacterium ADurb.Bin419]|nr:MAG: hypothetical protein BWY74_03504 [Firmicutes bacterium ADurb.Bin419]
MGTAKKFYENNSFESTIKEYLKQARSKLENELTGTREAMRLIAIDKTHDFLKVMDRGLDKEERDYLSALIVASMYQSFCYGYGIGKIEGKNDKKIVL